MRRRNVTLGLFAAAVFAVTGAGASATDSVANGAHTVQANAIWFENADALSEWQRLKAGGDAAAITAYEERGLGEREAWKFSNELAVKVLGIEPDKRQAHVEMTSPGRMLGTAWFVDAQWLEP